MAGVIRAYAAMKRGVPAKIFVPTVTSKAKLARLKDYGADVTVTGERYADALVACDEWSVQTGALSIHAFDQPETLLGQGTLGLEFEQQAPKRANSLSRARSRPAGRREAGGIAADSLAPRRVGELMFPIARDFVDHVILVTDDSIRAAQEALWNTLRVATEPGGAAAFAALASSRYQPGPAEHVGVVLCGGNTTAVDFSR